MFFCRQLLQNHRVFFTDLESNFTFVIFVYLCDMINRGIIENNREVTNKMFSFCLCFKKKLCTLQQEELDDCCTFAF
jgi:hypothetical protein